MPFRRKLLLAAGVAQLGIIQATHAQVPVPAFALPPPAAIVVIPLLLLAASIGMELSKSDESRVRDLEKAGNWNAIVALADRRLAEKPEDPHWRALRGWALQRAGRCAEALPDLRTTFERRIAPGGALDEASFASGLALGLCQLAAGDLDTGRQTMERLAVAAPDRWEPPYQLGVIGARRGDLEAVEAAITAVRAIDRPMAETLRAYASAEAAKRTPPGPAVAGILPPPTATHPAVSLSGQHLTIGQRTLVLPAGNWALCAIVDQVVMAGNLRHPIKSSPVALVTVHAVATTSDGRAQAALAITANPARARGLMYWDAQAFCDLHGAIHVEKFRGWQDRPECLSVRVVDDGAAPPGLHLAAGLRAARQAGAAVPSPAYEVHYSRYDIEWMVASTWLLPMDRFAGDLAAVQWARSLAAQMRPLADRRDAATAIAPPLEP